MLFLGKDADSGWYAADGCGNSGSSNGRPRTVAQIKALERAKDGGLIEVNVYIAEGAGLRGPLADLTVTLVGTESVTAKTDKDGWARFRVPLGTYAARASNPEWGVTQFDMTYEDAGSYSIDRAWAVLSGATDSPAALTPSVLKASAPAARPSRPERAAYSLPASSGAEHLPPRQ